MSLAQQLLALCITRPSHLAKSWSIICDTASFRACEETFVFVFLSVPVYETVCYRCAFTHITASDSMLEL